MIVTFTPNPLAETTAHIPTKLEVGRTHRAVRESFQVGGKGLNVAKMLHRLNVETTAISFAGGAPGEQCRRWLQIHASYATHLVEMATPLRCGLVIVDEHGTETTVLGPDCTIDTQAAAEASALLQAFPPHAIVALCGSFPGWASESATPLRQTFFALADQKRLVVDSYGPALVDLIDHPLEMVKINRDEFSSLMATKGGPADLAFALSHFPVQRWIVTDGANPIDFATSTHRGTRQPPRIREVSPTGSGDVFFATMLAGDWRNDDSWDSLIARAAHLAALNAGHPQIAEFDLPAQSP